ncbi:class A beta-lactamase-related serine hydrolase [Paenibacillus pinisoli]|uniref:Class A beta-lactamase-related serine hydrolase n=1 Tax=Paenibacillus pinisoli TaxID=1276110 RepID=A0A3A6PNT6_9BACL|nr:serine hydrolase domain-containing protein [Paenibacillus pinisoli]RJX39859.1 class A beta-lactamase-related serine hydrolase [Paenibacillus pinisoli]
MSEPYQVLNDYVYQVQQEIGVTAAAVYLIQNDVVVNEGYSGRQGADTTFRAVDAQTRFNVASIRKTYLGLAISLLMEDGRILSVDDEIGHYLDEFSETAEGVKLRHLLTHTHGLMERDGQLIREFEPGCGWAYRNTGIRMLTLLVVRLTGQTLSSFLKERVFDPYGLRETGWETDYSEELIYNYYSDPHLWTGAHDSDAGDQSNLFVSTRDLARWGHLHLRKGSLDGRGLIPASVFERVVTRHTPDTVPWDEPRNGFIWWLQHDTPQNQLGERLPDGSYLILGVTGCVCIVAPEYDAVIVRMYNQLSNPEGYNYLDDIRTFGNLAADLLKVGR